VTKTQCNSSLRRKKINKWNGKKELYVEKNIVGTWIYLHISRRGAYPFFISVYTSQQSKLGFAVNMEWVAERVGQDSYSALEQEYKVNF